MAAKYVLAALALVFFVLACVRRMQRPRAPDAAARTWLFIALIFTAVVAWLQWHTS
ncbi:hypothetical protein ACSFBM_33315 [Variovorax sp. GB1R11]|uniref:hypothetical protein n=1 Tax=Variovorax sp. GB1R11 TaxID=3443741 RepID=UPI003F44C973